MNRFEKPELEVILFSKSDKIYTESTPLSGTDEDYNNDVEIDGSGGNVFDDKG